MNSSAPSIRKIASNLLWTAEGVVKNPLVAIAADGSVLHTATCTNPDREAFTEFWPGVLVPGFPADFNAVFNRMRADPAPLADQLKRLVPAPDGVLVVISGLDYEAVGLTEQSRIRRLL